MIYIGGLLCCRLGEGKQLSRYYLLACSNHRSGQPLQKAACSSYSEEKIYTNQGYYLLKWFRIIRDLIENAKRMTIQKYVSNTLMFQRTVGFLTLSLE